MRKCTSPIRQTQFKLYEDRAGSHLLQISVWSGHYVWLPLFFPDQWACRKQSRSKKCAPPPWLLRIECDWMDKLFWPTWQITHSAELSAGWSSSKSFWSLINCLSLANDTVTCWHWHISEGQITSPCVVVFSSVQTFREADYVDNTVAAVGWAVTCFIPLIIVCMDWCQTQQGFDYG